ncbi:hypothetical protein ACJA25_00515 [Mycoplasmopsis hyopharyngis]|uniref:hypothetical protein n=1 Tax=Mycoplasmopsis hyopharyngis TaxID=29558 RepID=UPI003872EF32
MKIEFIKELFIILTPFIVTLGGVISALFVKIYNAKHNFINLKQEMEKLEQATKERQVKHAEELAKRDIVIEDLKQQLSQALKTIELLKTKVETKSGTPYIEKLENNNEEYKAFLSKAQTIIKEKDLEIERLKNSIKSFSIEIEQIKKSIQNQKEQEKQNSETVKATIY